LLALVSLAIVLALNLVEYVALPKAVSDFPATEIVWTAVTALVLTPLWLAFYRFLLMSEVAPRVALDVTAPRFVRFFAWSVLLSFVWLPATVLEFMWPDDDRVFWAGLIFAVVAYSIVAVRLVLLFPAIAIDAPGASVINAIADASGHFLNVLLLYLAATTVLVLALVLCAVVALFAAEFMSDGTLPPELPGWVVAAIATLLMFGLPLVAVAIDARIFPALADRTLRASG